jgi:uncharacterized protein (TIGR02145 family)
MKRISLIATLIICCLTCFAQRPGTFRDPRDKKLYKTLRIVNQTWFIENLAFKAASGHYCVYGNDSVKAKKYGFLYDWETAKSVCPTGWHLPSKEEFVTLLVNNGGPGKKAYNALVADGKSGFSALLGGSFDDTFNGIGIEDKFWSSSLAGSGINWILEIGENKGTRYAGMNSFNCEAQCKISVRCIKN